MPIYALLERQRVRQRGRATPNAPGNYVTSRIQAQWYTLTMNRTESHYQASALMKPQFAKAIGYQDNPPPKPPWVPLVQLSDPQTYVVVPADVQPPRVLPDQVPQGVNPVIPLAFRGGLAGAFVPGVTPAQLNATKLAIRRVTILADPANALDIWCGYSPYITVNNAFPLAAGAARDFDIDDLSQLWLLGENATDQVFFIYEI